MPLFNLSRRPNVQELKSQEDVDGLIEALNFPDDPNIRLDAASALGQIGDSRAVKPLIAALDDQQGVIEMAALALGEMGDPRAVDPLTEPLNHGNWEVRSSAAKALGKIGDERAVDPLTKLLDDRNESVRWHTVQALESITGDTYSTNMGTSDM
jgi:HEAT repeat protein